MKLADIAQQQIESEEASEHRKAFNQQYNPDFEQQYLPDIIATGFYTEDSDHCFTTKETHHLPVFTQPTNIELSDVYRQYLPSEAEQSKNTQRLEELSNVIKNAFEKFQTLYAIAETLLKNYNKIEYCQKISAQDLVYVWIGKNGNHMGQHMKNLTLIYGITPGEQFFDNLCAAIDQLFSQYYKAVSDKNTVVIDLNKLAVLRKEESIKAQEIDKKIQEITATINHQIQFLNKFEQWFITNNLPLTTQSASSSNNNNNSSSSSTRPLWGRKSYTSGHYSTDKFLEVMQEYVQFRSEGKAVPKVLVLNTQNRQTLNSFVTRLMDLREKYSKIPETTAELSGAVKRLLFTNINSSTAVNKCIEALDESMIDPVQPSFDKKIENVI